MNRVRLAAMVLSVAVALALLGSLIAGLGRGSAAPRGSSPSADEGPVRPRERIRVEVLNAAGVPGLARAATQRLRDAGLDVVYYGNASTFGRDSSVVLVRLDDRAAARRVGEAAGIDRIRAERDTTLYVDVTVVLGRDWAARQGLAADSL